jgi:neutral ceramidase
VLKVADDSGNLYAVLFGYACHATVLDGYLWSGDYPGFAQAALEERYPGATALFFAGCGADMNPLPRRQVPLVRQYGETLASAVAAQLEGEMKSLEAVFKTGYAETELTMLPPPEKEELEARVAATGGYEQRCTQQLLDMLETDGSLPVSYPYPVQAWKLGDQILAMLSGEPVVEYTLALKESLGQDIFVMGYANDYVSYIPSERILSEGGYEGCASQIIFGLPNCWAPGLEARILTTLCDLVGSLD